MHGVILDAKLRYWYNQWRQ